MSRFFIDKFKTLIPYTPGEQPKDMKYIKLNTNENPYPAPADVVKAATESAERLFLYSDPTCSLLRAKMAEVYGVSPDEISIHNGSDEALYFAFMAFCDQKTPAVFADITYGFYQVFADFIGVPYEQIPLKDDFSLDPTDYMGINKTIFIANPNAPTGLSLDVETIEEIVKSNPDNVVVIDEAYVDFGGTSCVPLIKKYDNLLVLSTFSKSRSMAGARLGFAFGCPELIKDLTTLRYSTNPYNVNSMTLAAGLASMNNEAYTKECCRKVIATREWTTKKLRELGFEVLDSKANFVFAKHPDIDGEKLYLTLKERGILVRHFSAKRICQYNRISIGTDEQMRTLISVLSDIISKQ